MPTSQEPKFCKNCGQQVEGEAAVKAANPAAVYCCECGQRLLNNGTCKNPNCPYFKSIPSCT
jgi:hypothetical protein